MKNSRMNIFFQIRATLFGSVYKGLGNTQTEQKSERVTIINKNKSNRTDAATPFTELIQLSSIRSLCGNCFIWIPSDILLLTLPSQTIQLQNSRHISDNQ